MGLWPFPGSGFDAAQRQLQQQQQQSEDQTRDLHRRHPSQAPTSNTAQDRQQHDDPFQGFRRFMDDQMQVLADGLATIPAILSDLQARGSDSRWTSPQLDSPMSSSPHHEPSWPSPSSCPYSSEAVTAARALLIQSRNANAAAGVTPSAVLALYREAPSHEAHMGVLGPLSVLFTDPLRQHHLWLSVDWFKHSRYSPTNLETHRHAHQHGSMWRAAFEDLMSTSLGKEEEGQRSAAAWRGKVNDQQRYGAWAATPRDWMLGLQCRGVLPPQLPSLYQLDSPKLIDRVFERLIKAEEQDIPPVGDFWDLVAEVGTFDADERRQAAPETTELDVYEHFLGRANGKEVDAATVAAREQKQRVKAAAVEPVRTIEPAQTEPVTSRILSTLSTTEQTTLPDGTVTTKVVLKKRFADGREESTETVSTTHGSAEHTGSASSSSSSSMSQQMQLEEGKGNKAWFWS